MEKKTRQFIKFVVNLKKRKTEKDYFFLHIPKKYNQEIQHAKYIFVKIKPLKDSDFEKI